jgi:hypothetical protein
VAQNNAEGVSIVTQKVRQQIFIDRMNRLPQSRNKEQEMFTPATMAWTR